MFDDPLSDEEIERLLLSRPAPAPSARVRERVLRRCHDAMEIRSRRERRSRNAWRWALAAALLLMVLNGKEDRQFSNRIIAMTQAPTANATLASRPPTSSAIRAHLTLLASLLRESHNL